MERQRINLENQAITPEKNSGRKFLLGRLVALGPVIAPVVLFAACRISQTSTPESTPAPTPTSILEPYVEEDRTGDGIINVQDVRAQKGADWPPGLDFNDDLIIDQKDVNLAEERVGTKPADPLYSSLLDVDGKNGITPEDVAIIEEHIGETVKADPESKRFRDGAWYADQMVIELKENTPQEKIDKLIEKRGFENLRQATLSQVKRIIVIAVIPQKVLAENELGDLIEEVSKENGVINANRFYLLNPQN